jgi:hypothetical protein
MKIREIISNIQEEAAIKVSVYEEKLEKLRASFEVTKSRKMECEKLTVIHCYLRLFTMNICLLIIFRNLSVLQPPLSKSASVSYLVFSALAALSGFLSDIKNSLMTL